MPSHKHRMQPASLLNSSPVALLRARRLRSFFGVKSPAATLQRIVHLETCASASLSRLARARERYRSERLCGCQSASLGQPQTHQRKHRRSPASVPRFGHRWRGPPHFAPGLGCGSPADCDPLDIAGKYQVLWRVEGFTFEQQESALKLLAITFGGDPACTDCNRVLRLPGFLNRKYDPAYPVTVEYPSDSTWNSDDFRLDILAADAMLSSRAITPRKHPAKAHQFRARLGMGSA